MTHNFYGFDFTVTIHPSGEVAVNEWTGDRRHAYKRLTVQEGIELVRSFHDLGQRKTDTDRMALWLLTRK